MRYVFAILALGLLIAVHELGHLLAARLFGIRVPRFSFGFGPPIFAFKTKRTEWRLGALLLGGRAQVFGSNPHEEGAESAPDSYRTKALWKRELVLASGSIVNYALAIAVLVGLFVYGTHVPVAMTVGTVEPGSVAARAQLRPGDVIVKVNGEPEMQWGALVEKIFDSPGQALTLTVSRDGAESDLRVTPQPDERGIGRIGVTQQYVFRSHRFGESLGMAFAYTGRLVEDGLHLLWRMVLGRPGAEESPVLVVKQASDTAAISWDAFLRVLAHLSVALALFNLIPWPSLDGGRMVFLLIERVRKKPVDPRLETALNTIGFLVLLAATAWIATAELRARLAATPPTGTEADAGTEGSRDR